MKIVHVLCSSQKGGLETAFFNINRLLIRMGHEVEVWLPFESPYRDCLQRDSHSYYAFSPRGYYDVFRIIQAHLRLRTVKPDLVLTHNARATSILGLALKSLTAPLVGFSHSNKIRRMLKADYLIGLTEDMCQRFWNAGYEKDRTAILPNFVFERPPFVKSIKKDTGNVGFVGRMTAEKGLDTLLTAFSQVVEIMPDTQLHLAGSGPDKEDILALAESLSIRHKVHIHGWVEDIGGWLRDIDLLVVPSLSETFGIVILEAAVHGCPVIASDVSGPASQIQSGSDGWLVPPGNAQQLADGICAALQHAEHRASVATMAYKRSESYTVEAIQPRLKAILEQSIYLGRKKQSQKD
ncbi:hypothetical protein CFI10_18155 [Marinobacterium iners]|uniref:glycosyltransferase family 4 protein n=1 Tax=Marinobacterium iners TaxID=48076 RepID=UPI001A8D833C|nr:glycosyltransferase family 4 protein [Marinobacterium iners]QSR36864.1 hypothetical protein CFI10_18155 [Marinobacterium iners]